MNYDSRTIEEMMSSAIKKLAEDNHPRASAASVNHSSIYADRLHIRDRDGDFIAEFWITGRSGEVRFNDAHSAAIKRYPSSNDSKRERKGVARNNKARVEGSQRESSRFHYAVRLLNNCQYSEAEKLLTRLISNAGPLALEAKFKRAQARAALGECELAEKDYVEVTGTRNRDIISSFLAANAPSHLNRSSSRQDEHPRESRLAEESVPSNRQIEELRAKLALAIRTRDEAMQDVSSLLERCANQQAINQSLYQDKARETSLLAAERDKAIQAARSATERSQRLSAEVSRLTAERNNAVKAAAAAKARIYMDEVLAKSIDSSLLFLERLIVHSAKLGKRAKPHIIVQLRRRSQAFKASLPIYSKASKRVSRQLYRELRGFRLASSKSMALVLGASFALGHLAVSIPISHLADRSTAPNPSDYRGSWRSGLVYRIADSVLGGSLTRDRVRKSREVMERRYNGLHRHEAN